MNIKSKVLEKYNNSPDKEKVGIYMSGIYLLLSIQLEWSQEIEELVRKHGVYAKEFKYYWNLAVNALDRLEREMKGTIIEISRPQLNEEYYEVHRVLTNYIFNTPEAETKQLKTLSTTNEG